MSQSRHLAIPRIVCLSPGKINLLKAMRDTEGIFTPHVATLPILTRLSAKHLRQKGCVPIRG